MELIKSLSAEIMGSVKKKIASHKEVFLAKTEAERNALVQAAAAAAQNLNNGEVARSCPACESQGVLSGTRIKVFPEKYEDEQLLALAKT